jgi:pimeloyl-ACP methyl ester carboxylesterase
MEVDLAIRAAGVGFHARQRGEPPGSVFLHGFAGDLHTWDAVWAQLGDAFCALRYDLRGFGLSGPGNGEPYTHGEDLLAILDATGIDVVDLVGVSMGGGIALNFALDYPERVRNLVLISPALVAWEWSHQWRTLWQPIAEFARAGNVHEARRLWWQHPLFASTRESAAGQTLYDSIMRFGGAQWVNDTHRPMLPDVERLYCLKTRTLLLTGGRDLADFRLIADLLEASVDNLERIDSPACGHLLHLEDPDACSRHIAFFLSGCA